MDWVSVSASELSVDQLTTWATRDTTGAVVSFSGAVRSTSGDHDDITSLEYDASEELAERRIRDIIAVARSRWPQIVAVAVHHRTGVVRLGESSVIVVVSSAHRREAFEASMFCIDTLKSAVPIWKRDIWDGGSAWSSDVRAITEIPEP